MKHINFEGANLKLTAPAGKEAEVDTLIAFKNEAARSIVSAWKPDADDLKMLNDGGHVLLHIYSSEHPPVQLTVQKMTEVEP